MRARALVRARLWGRQWGGCGMVKGKILVKGKAEEGLARTAREQAAEAQRERETVNPLSTLEQKTGR